MEIPKLNYQRYLPHWQKPGATYFITSRLHGSLPAEVLSQLHNRLDADILEIRDRKPLQEQYALIQTLRKRHFLKLESLLDAVTHGPDYLRHPEIAGIVAERVKKCAEGNYTILAYCIMPNHVHLLIDTAIQIADEDQWEESFKPLHKTMQLIKGGSSFLCNQALGRTGTFWQKESYDHLIRSQKELDNVLNYILYNPVKARLCQQWQGWPHLFCSPDFSRDF